MRRIGVGPCWATSLTIVPSFRLAVSITWCMLPERSTQKSTSTLFRAGALSCANTEPATIRLISVAIIVLFIGSSSIPPSDAGWLGEFPEFIRTTNEEPGIGVVSEQIHLGYRTRYRAGG